MLLGKSSWCALDGIAFIPFFPLATGALADAGGPRAEMAVMHQPAQLALAWLVLKRSPVMLPIIGTASVTRREADVLAACIELSDDEHKALSAVVISPEPPCSQPPR